MRERRLLNALAGRVKCAIPEVICATDDERLQLRSAVEGNQIQGREPAVGSARDAELIAEGYGRAIASLHRALDRTAAAFLIDPNSKIFTISADRLQEASDRWLRDPGLARDVMAVLDTYAALKICPADSMGI
jgi:hypothetical protein